MLRDEPDLAALGRLVREQRRKLGWTQVELAGRLHWEQERISLLERGRYGLPSLPMLARLAAVLHLTMPDLLAALGVDEAIAGGDPDAVRLLQTVEHILSIEASALHAALDAAATEVAAAVGADKVDAFLFDPATNTLVAQGVSDTPMGRLEQHLGLDRLPLANGGHVARVHLSGEPFINNRVDQAPDEIPGVVSALGVRSVMAVPLNIGGERRGVLAAASAQADHFSGADLIFLQLVARWLGVLASRFAAVPS